MPINAPTLTAMKISNMIGDPDSYAATTPEDSAKKHKMSASFTTRDPDNASIPQSQRSAVHLIFKGKDSVESITPTQRSRRKLRKGTA